MGLLSPNDVIDALENGHQQSKDTAHVPHVVIRVKPGAVLNLDSVRAANSSAAARLNIIQMGQETGTVNHAEIIFPDPKLASPTVRRRLVMWLNTILPIADIDVELRSE